MGIRPGRIDQDSSLTSDALLLAMVKLVEGIGGWQGVGSQLPVYKV